MTFCNDNNEWINAENFLKQTCFAGDFLNGAGILKRLYFILGIKFFYN